VPGFVGRCENGHSTLLGRGGSDLTALFLAAEMGAECVLLKDVGGLFTGDPAEAAGATGGEAPPVRRFATIGWETARGIAGGAVQDKALRFAAQRGLDFSVRSPGAADGTRVGALADRLYPSPPPQGPPPLRVALLGCGTVGGGVLRHLLDRPERYAVAGVAVRDPSRRPSEVPVQLLMTADALVSGLPEVLIEVAGGLAVEPWLRDALRRGIDVVTANKALLATRGAALREDALAGRARLLASAAVGGALPVLERVRRLAPRGVRSVRAVLNGTSTFVLDRLAAGEGLAAAVAAARELGFAEADPRLDLDGTDAAQKLALLLEEAFPGCPALAVRVRGIDAALEARIHARRGTWRLVAQATRDGAGVQARVGVRRLREDDFLARSTGAGCALEVLLADGEIVRACAQGAGRWPTAEAVLADLEDLRLDPRRRSRAGSRCMRRGTRATGASIAEPMLPETAPALSLAAGGGES
jgi:homoserine dehydrogenase